MNRLKSNALTVSIVFVLLILAVVGFFLIPFRSDNADRVHFSGPVHELVLGHG
jgi:hypothetical protein